MHMSTSLGGGDAKRTTEEPQEAAYTQRDSWAVVPQAHAVWNTTPLSLGRLGKSRSATASPLPAWNHTRSKKKRAGLVVTGDADVNRKSSAYSPYCRANSSRIVQSMSCPTRVASGQTTATVTLSVSKAS